ncbi:MAG: hypothetical protein HN872_03885 [Gammaproteobacteria bacterium]|jgi:hypothetical protein|nr:hypothetical protein [Pseudomonadales bacterium]MBT6482250.1 hypothetical protein [Gammaproteobacteria bacterium]MBT7225733.1 hypothetical protein [Gammaproteobacteria bacterium]MDB3909246.1 hypothetical protein [Gammaproteobacteria bacterium]MDC0414186.1 hypothetical protein [Gammaproteobacteria bacterium]
MNTNIRRIIICIAALLVAVATVVFIAQNPALIGSEPLFIRAALLSLAIIAALIAVYPFNPLFSDKPGIYAAAVCMPAIVPVLVYYFVLLPQQAGVGISAEQVTSEMITDSSSNGIIEVGFSYPIYTPALRVSNLELFTKQVNVFMRMTDANGEAALFRAVRTRIPGSSLSVESTVQGMLSESDGYGFIPLQIPPASSITTRVAFIISNLDNGSNFTDALRTATQAQFELRDPETGELLLEFPLNPI